MLETLSVNHLSLAAIKEGMSFRDHLEFDFDNVVQSSSKNKGGIVVSLRNSLFHHCCFSHVAVCLVWWFLFLKRAKKSRSVSVLWECRSKESVFLRIMFGSDKEPMFCKRNV